MIFDVPSSSNKQEQLRTWYLARLRRKALEESETLNFTPAALINADKQSLEKFMSSKSAEGPRTAFEQVEPLVPRKTLGKQLGLALIAMGWATASAALLVTQAWTLPFATSLFLLFTGCCIVSAWDYFQLTARLELLTVSLRQNPDLNKALSNAKSGAIGIQSNPISDLTAEELLSQTLFRLAKLEGGQRLIADYSSDVLCAFDKELKLIAASPSCRRIWGYHPAELSGDRFWGILSGEYDQKLAAKAFSNAIITRKESRCETRLIAANEKELHFRWTIDWSETEQTFFVVASDITAAKRLETLKQEFFAVIGHDVRSPIANIISTIALIEHGRFGELTPDGRKRLKALEATTTYVIEVLNDLLDLEKIESSSFKIHRQQANLEQVLREAVEAVNVLAEDKGVQITIGPVDPHVEIDLDAVRIKRVIINLLSNAIKFSPASQQILLNVSITGSECQISVRDFGRGISANDQKLLFNRFYQIEAEDATLRGGVGIGLQSCQDIVRAHGGSISVTSEIGKGSTFTVHLPTDAGPRK